MNSKKIKNVYEQLVIKLEERSRLGGVMATMHWDQEVIMPISAAENRSKQMAALAGVLHEKSVDVEFGRLIDELVDADIDNFTEIEQCNIYEAKREYELETKIPKQLIQEMAELSSSGHQVWAKARQENKFEDFYNEKFHKDYPPEFDFFKNFHNKYKKLKPYRTEWRIFDDSLSLAGTVDMVYQKENGELFIFDWKRTSKLIDQNNQPILKDFNYGLGGLSHIADNSFNKYALQQNLYKHILEEYYGKKISSMNLLVLHPNYHTFFHVPIPEMKKETEFLINQSIEKSR